MPAKPTTPPFPLPRPTRATADFPNGGLAAEYLHDHGSNMDPLKFGAPRGEPCIYETETSINQQSTGSGTTSIPRRIRAKMTSSNQYAYTECERSGVGVRPSDTAVGSKCYICGVNIQNPNSNNNDDDGGECEHIIPFILLLLLVGINNSSYCNRRDKFWDEKGAALAAAGVQMTKASYVAVQEDLWKSAYLWSCTPCNKFKSNFPFINIILGQNGYKLTLPDLPFYPFSVNLQDQLLSLMCNNKAQKPKTWRSLYSDQAQHIWTAERARLGRGVTPAECDPSDENTEHFINARLRESMVNMRSFVNKIRVISDEYSALTLIIARDAILKSTKSNNIGTTIATMVNIALGANNHPTGLGGGGSADGFGPSLIAGGSSKLNQAGGWREGFYNLELLAATAEAAGTNPSAGIEFLNDYKSQILTKLYERETWQDSQGQVHHGQWTHSMDVIIGAILVTYIQARDRGWRGLILSLKMEELVEQWGALRSWLQLDEESADHLRGQLTKYLEYEGDLIEMGVFNPKLLEISTSMINDCVIDTQKQLQRQSLPNLQPGSLPLIGEDIAYYTEEGELESAPTATTPYEEIPYIEGDIDIDTLLALAHAEGQDELDDMYIALNCYTQQGIQYALGWFINEGNRQQLQEGLRQDLLAIRARQQQSFQVNFSDGYNQHGDLVAVLAKYLSLGLTPDAHVSVFKNIIGGADSVIREYIHAAQQYQQQTQGGGMVTESGAPKCQPCSTNEVYKPPKKKSLRKKNKNKKRKTNKKSKKKIIKKSPKYSKKKSFKKKSFKKSSKRNTLRKSKRKSKK